MEGVITRPAASGAFVLSMSMTVSIGSSVPGQRPPELADLYDLFYGVFLRQKKPVRLWHGLDMTGGGKAGLFRLFYRRLLT